MKKLISAFLCIILIFCTAGIAFADEPVNEDAAVYVSETETRDGAVVAADPVEEISDDEAIIPGTGPEQEDESGTDVPETAPEEEAETVYDPTPVGSYNLTLNANYEGGQGDYFPGITSYVLPVYSREDNNYTFLGWSESPSGPVQYNGGELITLTSDLVLYAVWGTPLIGEIPASDGGYVYVGGICWRVIGVSDTRWLLISADVLGGFMTWYDAKNYCGTVYESFSPLEKVAVAETTKIDAAYGIYAAADLSGAKLFLLSASEAMFYLSSDADRMLGWWWLRSPNYYDANSASAVFGDGEVLHYSVNNDDRFGARPAFQLDLGSVLFTSAAEGGKSSGDTGADALTAVGTNTGNEWKVTLKGLAPDFAVSYCAGSYNSETGAVTVKYTGAAGNYISAVVTDSTGETIKKYGRIAEVNGADGVVTINTADKMDEGDKLFVFCEHYRGDRNTDYASELKEIPLPTTGDHIWIDATCTEPKTCAACGLTEGEANGHSFVYALSEDAAGIIAMCSAGNCPSGYNQNGITVILSAPEDLVYDGKAKEASISGYQPDVPDLEPEPEIIYYASAGEGSTEPSGGALPGAPSEAGSYVARIIWGGQTASRAFTIVKEDAAVTSAPAAKKLTYSGAAQELVTAGKASGGTMAYSLTPDGAFTETIPKGTDAAGYTVYYKAIGDAYHNDSAVGGPVNVTISPAGQPITAAAGKPSLSVGKTTKITVTGAKGKVTYTSGDTGIAAVSSTGVVTAKKVGTVKITVSAAAIDNYKKTTKTVTIKVVPAATASFSAENQKTGIALSWKKVAGATGYYIYRNDTQIKKITSGSTLTYKDTKATGNGTKYKYKVIAYASTGTSTLSKTVTIYGVKQPAISSLTNPGTGKMTVKWGKNTKGTGYEIQYARYSSFTGKKTVTITSKSTGSKAITSLTKGKTYYVRVRTYKTVSGKKYYSAWSPTKSVKIVK